MRISNHGKTGLALALVMMVTGTAVDAAAMGAPLPVECNPTVAETGPPQQTTEGAGSKLDVIQVQQDTMLQSFDLYLAAPGGGSAWFVVYEGTSLGAPMDLVFSDQVTIGDAGWYASGLVDLDMAASHYYAVGFVATPGVVTYRSDFGMTGSSIDLVGGVSVGGTAVNDPVTLTPFPKAYAQRLHLAAWCQPFSIYDYDIDNDGVERPADCDDWDAAVYPGAAELCDGKDNDCNGYPNDDELDLDGDGYSSCGGDCNDADPALHRDLDGDGQCDPDVPPTVLVDDDFEGPPYELLLGGAPYWTVCDPVAAAVGPGYAAEGMRFLGTNCYDTYDSNVSTWVYVAPIDFSGFADARLSFQTAYDMEYTYDGVQVMATPDQGVTWTAIEPVGGYPCAHVSALGGPGYSGSSAYPLDWQPEEFDLGDLLATESEWSLAWFFATDLMFVSDGFFMDSVVVEAW